MQKTGEIGEDLATHYLRKKGYIIIERNYIGKDWRGPQKGEIDIVAKKDGVLHFVEVKTSFAQGQTFAQNPFPPEDRVSYQKQMKILKAAQRWFVAHRRSPETKWQIDVVAVELNSHTKKAKMRHFQNVVSSS